MLNEYAEPKERYWIMKIFYFPDRIFMVKLRTISESVMWYGSASVHHVDTENAAEMDSLIANPDRKFPVIVFMAADKEWTEKFDVDYFSYLVGYYAHIMFVESGIRSFCS